MQDQLTRSALWEAHNHVCAYCGEQVSLPEMQVDHVIPEILNANQVERTRVLQGLEIHATANLDDLWNRLPSHRRCNRIKSDDILNDGSLRFYLAMAKRAEPKVISEIEKLRKRNTQDRLNAAIALAIASGETSVSEVIRTVVKSGSDPQLIAKMQDNVSMSPLLQAVIQGESVRELLAAPILPRLHGLESLTMEREGKRVAVVNCEDWAKYRREGFYTPTTYDIKEESFFHTAYATLRALEVATPSRVSFLGSVQLSISSSSILPTSLVPYMSSDDAELVKQWIAQGVSLLDLSNANTITLEDTEHGLKMAWVGMEGYIGEILRADLNGDGIEDILYSYYARASGGTFGAGHVGVLTRRSPTAMLEQIEVDAMSP